MTQRHARAIITAGLVLGSFLAIVSVWSRCPNQCSGEVCTLMGCTDRFPDWLILGLAIAAAGAALGVWMIRRHASTGDT